MIQPRLRLRTLGALTLSAGDGPLDGSATVVRRLALLSVVAAVEPNAAVSRDTLLFLFWPDRTEERARSALKQLTFAIRKSLREDQLFLGSDVIRLNPEVICSDVGDLLAAVRRGDAAAVVAASGGPFLDGVHVSDAPEFERWAAERRAEYAAAFHTALETLAAEASAAGRFREASEWWRRRANAEPFSSRAATSYALSLADAGDRPAALRHLSTHRALVVAELGTEPDPEVSALEDRLKNGPAVKRAISAERPSSPDQSVGPPPFSPKTDKASPRGAWRRTGLVSAALAVAAAIALFASRPHADTPAKPTIAVVEVSSSPNDSLVARWNQLAVAAIEGRLAEAGFGRPVQVRRASRSMVLDGRGVSGSASEDVRGARAAGAQYALLSVIARDGDTIVASARLVSVADETLLRIVRPVRGTVDRAKLTLDEFEQRSIGMVATLLDPRAASLTSLETTGPLYPAFRSFMDGLTEFEVDRDQEAIKLFENAYARDTTFTLPLIWSAFAAANSGLSSKHDSLVAWMAEHKDRFDPANQFGIESFVALHRRDAGSQLAALQQASAAKPGSEWSYLLAEALMRAGRHGEEFDAIKLVDPVNGWARGWDSYWGAALNAFVNEGRLKEFLPVLRAARAKMPRANGAAVREVFVLSLLGQDAEFFRALREYEAEDRQPRDIDPGVLLEQLASMARSAQNRKALGEECVQWFRQPRSAVELDGLRRSTLRASCLYYSGRNDQAERELRQLVDSLDRHGTAPSESEILKKERANMWGLFGTVLALNGKRAAAETALMVVQSLPEPRYVAPQNYNLKGAARLAAALGHRELAMELAMRVRMCCGGARPGKAFLSPFDPAFARYQADSAFFDAFGLIPPTDARAGSLASSMRAAP